MKISFETAKLAREKGFNLPTNDYYYVEKNKIISDNGDGDNEFICLNHNFYDNYFSAPYQSSLQKWLRDIHNIDCHVMGVRFTGDIEIAYYTYAVQSIQPVGKQKYKFDSWEEALEVGLTITLNLIE